MTTITTFDHMFRLPLHELADLFVTEKDADVANKHYQVMYAKINRQLTGEFWRPTGHPHASEDGDRMTNREAHHFIDLAIKNASVRNTATRRQVLNRLGWL